MRRPTYFSGNRFSQIDCRRLGAPVGKPLATSSSTLQGRRVNFARSRAAARRRICVLTQAKYSRSVCRSNTKIQFPATRIAVARPHAPSSRQHVLRRVPKCLPAFIMSARQLLLLLAPIVRAAARRLLLEIRLYFAATLPIGQPLRWS